MTGLTEVYDGGSLRRLTIGASLFVVGAAAALAGIVLATTAFGADLLGVLGAREVAGVLAGLGVPVALVGVLTTLPARPRVRVASVLGLAVAGFAVGLFWMAYPSNWVHGDRLAGPTVAVYFVGVVVVFWALFAGVATFQRRRSPGGTVQLEVRDGEPRIVTVPRRIRSTLGGGVGLLGGVPDPGPETQTATRSDGGTATAQTRTRTRTRARGDADATADDPELSERERASRRSGADPYCGNCERFRYVRTEDGLEPFCGYDGTLMDDMDACENWTANTDRTTELDELSTPRGQHRDGSDSGRGTDHAEVLD